MKTVTELERELQEAKARDPKTVITVRLPESLHVKLKEIAHDQRTSLNKLCVQGLESLLPQG